MINEHLNHIEDLIFIENGNQILYDILHNIENHSVSLKMDGSPSIFLGRDDNDVFVSKKSIFNLNPILYKSEEEIDLDQSLQLDLKFKLKTLLHHSRSLDINGVLQGDFLFTQKDLYEIQVDGVSYIAFHPNTIVYAIQKESSISDTINASSFGVAWHTRYGGKSIKEMSIDFGGTIQEEHKGIEKSYSHDIRSSLQLSEELISEIDIIKSQIRNIDQFPAELEEHILKSLNYNIRIDTPSSANLYNILCIKIEEFFEKQISHRKTEKSKESLKERCHNLILSIPKNIDEYIRIHNQVQSLKKKMTLANETSVQTFLLKKNGEYVKCDHEGYVLRVGDSMSKIVNRNQFSRANFGNEYCKGWRYSTAV